MVESLAMVRESTENFDLNFKDAKNNINDVTRVYLSVLKDENLKIQQESPVFCTSCKSVLNQFSNV